MATNQDYKKELAELTAEVNKLKAANGELEKSLILLNDSTKKQATNQSDLAGKTKANKDTVVKLTKAQKAEAEIQRLATAEGKKEIAAQVKLTDARKKARIEAQKNQGILKKSGGLFKSMTKSILASGAAFFGATAIISGVKQLVGNLFELSKQMQGESIRATVVFRDQLEYVEDEADKLAKKMGVTTREFISMAAATADLLIPLDFTREQSAKMSVELQGLTGALDEWTAGSVGAKEISEILTKAMLGENEQLKRLGIAIRKDTDEYRDLVKIKLQTTGTTKAQAEALATLELIQKKSTDAQTAYTQSGNKLLRLEKEFKRVIREKKENFIKLFDVEKEQPNLYRLENKELTTLFGSLKNTNLSQDARNKLITTINDKYGEYLPNLLTEKSTLEDIEAAEASINKQVKLKIIQQAFQEEINELLKAELQAKEQIVGAEILADKAAQQRISGSTELGAIQAKQSQQAADLIGSLAQSTIDSNEEEVASTKDKFKRIGELYGIAFAEIEAALNENVKVVEGVDEEIVESSNDTEEKRTKIVVDGQLDRIEAEKITSSAAEDLSEEELNSLKEQLAEEARLRKEASEERLKNVKLTKEQIDQIEFAAIESAGKIVTDRATAAIDEDLARIESAAEAKQTILDDQLDKGIISEETYTKKSAAIDLKARQESAKANKKKAQYENTINTVVAIAKTFAELGWPAGIAGAIVMGAIGAAQAVSIASEPLPQYEKGTNGQLRIATDAIVGEKGAELIDTPQGAYLSGSTAEYRHLPAGAEVFSHDSPETQAYLNGGMTMEMYEGLVNSNNKIEKAILNKPVDKNIITSGGWKYIVKTANGSKEYIDKYMRHV